jgi:hypothetical protein
VENWKIIWNLQNAKQTLTKPGRGGLVVEQSTTDPEIERSTPTVSAGNTKGGSITIPLTSCLTGLESDV